MSIFRRKRHEADEPRDDAETPGSEVAEDESGRSANDPQTTTAVIAATTTATMF